MRRAAAVAVVLIALAVAYLLFAPSPIDPLPFDPPPPMAFDGSLAPNEELRKATIIGAGQVPGPEDVDVDALGRIYGGTVDGRIVRVLADGTAETFARTGGRPLGLHFDAAGNLLVADGKKGLLSISPPGDVTTLVTGAGGVPFGFTNDVETAPDGQIYSPMRARVGESTNTSTTSSKRGPSGA
jgi:sugar lactone lactonase YvrE